MFRPALVSALLASACGSEIDDRPLTLEYITETILAPSCAAAQCHSAFRAQVGDVFSTPEASRRSIVLNHLVRYPDEIADPSRTRLIRTLTVGAESVLDPDSEELVRMPYDAPLPDADVELITAWIAAGIPGAQCQPNAEGRGCQTRAFASPQRILHEVVECPDGNVGSLVQVCGLNQRCDSPTGYGQCVAQ